MATARRAEQSSVTHTMSANEERMCVFFVGVRGAVSMSLLSMLECALAAHASMATTAAATTAAAAATVIVAEDSDRSNTGGGT